jgi:catechol 2,3-dioxygenase-like lactoylglutathione lyase family enzyme
VRPIGLDHVVLCVADAERSVQWYVDVLGLQPERLEEWRSGAAPFVSVRLGPSSVIDLLESPPTGRNVDHIAIEVADVDLSELAASGEVDVVRPPSRIWGAKGWGTGMYVADPDGHVIELKTYPSPGSGTDG